MLLNTKCPECSLVIRVLGRPEVLAALYRDQDWPEGFRCIRRGCEGRAWKVKPSEAAGARDIEAYAYYRAIHGGGVSNGDPADALKVREWLLEKKISRVVVEPIGSPERTLIHGIQFEDGSKLHFAASARGACIFFTEGPNDPVDSLASSRDSAGSAGEPAEVGQHHSST